MKILLSGYLYIIKSKQRYNLIVKYSKENENTTKIYDFYSQDGVLVTSYLEETTALGTYKAYYGKKHICNALLGYLNEIESSYSAKINRDKTLSGRGILETEERLSDLFIYKKVLLEGLTVNQEFKSSDYYFLLKEVGYKPAIEQYLEGEQGVYTVPYDRYKEYKQTSQSVATRVKTIEELQLEYDLEWITSKDYKVITDIEEFDKIVELLNKCVENKTIVAVDTETTGLRFNRLPQNHPSRDKLLGICLSWEKDQGVYIPVNHTKVKNIPPEYALSKLKYFLENGVILTHYGVFDWKVFWDYGINLNIMHDTYIIQYLVDVNYAKSVKKLKALTNLHIRYKGEPIHQLELEDFFPKVKNKKQKIVFDALGEEEIRCYAPADADFTRQLFFILYPKLPKECYGIYGVEIRLMKEMGYTEFYGFKISLETLQKRYENAVKEKEKITKEIQELAGEEFDINSPKQLAYILYTKLKFPILKEGKSGPSTGRAVLQDLLRDKKAQENPKLEIINKLLKYRELEKLISGFFQKLMKDHIDGWIFPHFNQAGTDSGRIAGYEPNLQQVSKKIRDIFVADSDEFYIFDADYSQIELRVMAGMAGDDFMINAFSDPDNDIHVAKAALLHGIPEDKVDKEMRTQSKKLNFGIPYGMGPVTLAHEIFGVVTQETISKAKYLYDKYFETSPKLKDLFTQLKDFASLTGYSQTKFGRRRYILDLKSPDRKKRESGLRKAGNTPIQGTAADILKMAYVRLATKLRELYPSEDFRNPKVRIAGSVHDEVLLIVHKSINPWVLIKLARECMELKIDGFPPIFIGMHVCNTWGDGKRDDLEIPIKLTDKMNKLVEQHPEQFGYEEDPLNYVFDGIKKFRLEEIKSYLESLGFNRVPVSFAKAKEKFEDLTCKKAVKDLFGNDLRKVLEMIYGAENVVDDIIEETIEETPQEEEEDLDDYFMDLRNKLEGTSDEEFEDYEDADVFRSEDENLLMEENPIRKLKDRLYNELRVIYFDLYIRIKIDGITKEGLTALGNYLKSIHTSNGYDILLELNGKLINTKLKAIRLDDDELIKCLYLEEYRSLVNM